MLLNFHLVATSLVASAACARALNASNFTTFNLADNKVGCGTPSPSQELWTHIEESLARGPNTTKREEGQIHRIPTHITVLYKNSTVEGGNIADSQIQEVLDQFYKFYSYGFFLDTSVDTIHRYSRPDLFDRDSGVFTGKCDDIRAQYHRGEGDYASLNIIFLFRLKDWYKIEKITTWQEPNSYTINTTSSGGGIMGWSSMPADDLWQARNALDLEKIDGMLLSSAIIPDMIWPGYPGSLKTFLHEFGHWVGLRHTDDSDHDDSEGKKLCDPINDGIEDTPTHILDENVQKALLSCPPKGQVNTCQHLDGRPDPVYNVMASIGFNCDVDRLTDGQMQKTLETFSKFRKPYKQQMQQRGRWVQPQGQQPQGQQQQDIQQQDIQQQDIQQQDIQQQDIQQQDIQQQDIQQQDIQQQDIQQQDQQPQNQQFARLQLESNNAWEKFRQEHANYHQQIQKSVQRNVNDCFNQVQQGYEQERTRLDKWTQDKYRQLQDYRERVREWLEGYWQQPQYREWVQQEWDRREKDIGERRQTYEREEQRYLGDLERNDQENQEWCRQRGQEEEARSLQDFETWEQKYDKALRDEDSRRQQYLASLQNQQQ